jgi:hypothetical protein
MGLSFADLKELLRRNGGDRLGEAVLNVLAAIGLGESGGDPTVRRYCPGNGYCYITRNGRTSTEREYPGQGPEDSIGLWQINRRAWGGTPAQYSDPDANARAAIKAYQQQGFDAWRNTYRSGKWRQYIGSDALDLSGLGDYANDAMTGGFGLSAWNQLVSNFFTLTAPQPSSDERFQPFLSQRAISGNQRFQIALVIGLVVIVFAWREL